MAKKSRNVSQTPPFVIHNIFSSSSPGEPRKETNRFLIVAHRDLDGLISAFFLAVAIRDKYPDIDVVFSQPYMANLLRKFLGQRNQVVAYSKIGFVDLSVDCTKPRTTKSLLKSLNGRIEYIFDHHAGWSVMLQSLEAAKCFNVQIEGNRLSTLNTSKHIVIGRTLCCAHLIYQYFNLNLLGNQYLDDLLAVAMLADDLNIRNLYKDTEEYKMFTNFKNNSLEACLGQLKVNDDVKKIKASSNHYSDVLDAADATLAQAEEVYPGVIYVKTFSYSSAFNYTALCEKAYANYNVVIVKELDPRRLRISYMVAHNIPGVDLVSIFGLNGGNPKRVTLYKKNCAVWDIVETLKPYIDSPVSSITT